MPELAASRRPDFCKFAGASPSSEDSGTLTKFMWSVLRVGVLAALLGVALLLPSPAAEAQCLDAEACAELKAEIGKLRPDLRDLRRQAKRLRRAFASLEPESDEWLEARRELRKLKREARALRRSARALRRDFRHQGCLNC